MTPATGTHPTVTGPTWAGAITARATTARPIRPRSAGAGADPTVAADDPGDRRATDSAALLRLAALPVAVWLAGGCPELLEQFRALDAYAMTYRNRADEVAATIGERLVPHPAVGRADRARALRVRRRLHNAGLTNPADPADLAELADVAERLLPDDGLATDLREMMAAGRRLNALRQEAEAAFAAEEHRVLARPWQLLHENPVAVRAMESGDIAQYDDIAARVRSGEPWTTKRMRQRSDYLWRMITRGATRATPRGWLAHVALLPITDRRGWCGTDVLRIRNVCAIEVAENLYQRRTELGPAETLLSDPSVEVSLAALGRLDRDHLTVWTVDSAEQTQLVQARWRRSPTLNAVIVALGNGPLPVRQMLDALTAQVQTERGTLTALLAHLAGQQALQVKVPAQRRLTAWATISASPNPPAPLRSPPENRFLDVYRQPRVGLAAAHARRLQVLARLALRLTALIDEDDVTLTQAPSYRPNAGLNTGLTAQPRPLLDIAADYQNARVDVQNPTPRRPEWPLPQRDDSGYADLVRSLQHRLDDADRIDLTKQTLDRFGAPEGWADWPVDCLLRPISAATGEFAVLDQFIPAGLYDARFAPALTELHGELPQVRAYRRFLDAASATSGVPFVEILAPPLGPLAANAVRRPPYTGWWTGDPDPGGYLSADRSRYLPLSEITLRTEAGQVIAEAAGQRIWPILHTARRTGPPWDTIVDLLLLASPQPPRMHWRVPTYSFRNWPDRTSMPRITLGGGLIVSPAQWRLNRDQVYRPGDRPIDTLLTVQRLQERHRIPRLVSVATDANDEPLAVDLHSLPGLRALDRQIQRGGPTVHLRELFAQPEELRIQDDAASDPSQPATPSVAEILLRLPPTPRGLSREHHRDSNS